MPVSSAGSMALVVQSISNLRKRKTLGSKLNHALDHGPLVIVEPEWPTPITSLPALPDSAPRGGELCDDHRPIKLTDSTDDLAKKNSTRIAG